MYELFIFKLPGDLSRHLFKCHLSALMSIKSKVCTHMLDSITVIIILSTSIGLAIVNPVHARAKV